MSALRKLAAIPAANVAGLIGLRKPGLAG